MAKRTYNRAPLSVEMGYYEKQALRDSYFNLNEFKGLCTDKNYVNVDRQTFAEVDNLYVNYDKELSIRPGLKEHDESFLTSSDSILNFWNLNGILFYHIVRNSNFYLICKYNSDSPMEVGEKVLLSELSPNYIVFYVSNGMEKVKGFTIINDVYTEISQGSLIYVPSVNNPGDENVLTSKKTTPVTITDSQNVDSSAVGKTVTIIINNKLYSIILNNNTNKVIVKKIGSMESLDYSVSDESSGHKILCYTNDFLYYSSTGETFYSYDYPNDIKSAWYKKAKLSKDANYIYVIAAIGTGSSFTIKVFIGHITSSNPLVVSWYTNPFVKLVALTKSGITTEFNTFTKETNTCMAKYKTECLESSVRDFGIGEIDDGVNGSTRGFVFTVPVKVSSNWKVINSSNPGQSSTIISYQDPGTTNANMFYTNAMISVFTKGNSWLLDWAILPNDNKFLVQYNSSFKGTLSNWSYSLSVSDVGYSIVTLTASVGNYYNRAIYSMLIWTNSTGADSLGHFVYYFNELCYGTQNNAIPVWAKISVIEVLDNSSNTFTFVDENINITKPYNKFITYPTEVQSTSKSYFTDSIDYCKIILSNYNNKKAWYKYKISIQSKLERTTYNPNGLYSDKLNNETFNTASVRLVSGYSDIVLNFNVVLLNDILVNNKEQYITVSDDWTRVLTSYFYFDGTVSTELINTDVGLLRPLYVTNSNDTNTVELKYADSYANLFSNKYGEMVVQVPESGLDSIVFPDGYLQSFDTVYYKGNKLYFCDTSTDIKGQLYWPVKDVFEFSSDITELSVLSESSFAVYLQDSVWIVNVSSDGVISKNKSKLQLGVKKGANVLPLYDGSSTLITTIKGLTALRYQEFVQSTDQVYTYLSENITEDYIKYYENPIQLAQYRDYVFLFNDTQKYLLLIDFRNSSWWKWTFEYPITKIVSSDKLYILLNSNVYYFDFLSLEFMDYNLFPIKWKFKTQKLHFNAPNNYKHIRSINMIIDTDIENFYYTVKMYNYRNMNNTKYEETFECEINDLTTSINRISFIKVNAFQLELSSYDKEDNNKFVTSNISIKYRVTERIR